MKNYLFIFTLIIALTGCSEKEVVRQHRYGGPAQGTYYAVTFFSKSKEDYKAKIDTFLSRFDQSVSVYQPASIISRMNNNDSTARADSIYTRVFRRAIEISDQTNGAFDITVGALVNGWGFGFKKREQMTPERIDSMLRFVGYKKVKLEEGRLKKQDPSVRIDFDAIAQGYAVDLLGEYLESEGINSYLIDIGGEVLGKGLKPDGSSWTVAIEMPSEKEDSERKVQAIMKLQDRAISTSGSYRKYYEENGVRYSHTIDPENGYPVKHNLLSVSVVAGDCMSADGFATAFMVMGVDKAMSFLEQHPGMEAYFISSGTDGKPEIRYTPGFEKLLIEN